MRIELAYRHDAVVSAGGSRSVVVLTPAKINLFLEIIGKRDDGFHELETAMATVDLHDTIFFQARDDSQINLKLIDSRNLSHDVPTDSRNLVVQALEKLRQRLTVHDLGCDVLLKKRIPAQAGLGGASSNAAAALIAGLHLWKLQLGLSQLHELAASLGSDIPFFLDFFLGRNSGCAFCRGRGEMIEPISGLPAGLFVVIAKPAFGLSTPAVYRQVEIAKSLHGISKMIKSVTAGDVKEISRLLFNRLQQAAIKENPEIEKLSGIFQQTSPLGHCLSGSGSSYFGIYATAKAARRATQHLSSRLPNATIFYSRTCRYLGRRYLRLSDDSGYGNQPECCEVLAP